VLVKYFYINLAKLLGEHYDVAQIVWARYTFHLVFLAILLRHRLPAVLRTVNLPMQLARSVLLLAASTLYFTGFILMPLADAAAIMNVTPLLVTVLSIPLLGEAVGMRRWIGVSIGLLGALIIIRPGLGVFNTAALFPLGSAVVYALYQIFTRRVSRTDSALTSITYTAVAGTVVCGVLAPFVWTAPDALGWVMMAATGMAGGIGHYCLIRAYTVSEVSAVAPYTYTVLVWMALSGIAVFGDLPDTWTVTGAAIIVASGVYILHRERARRQSASGA